MRNDVAFLVNSGDYKGKKYTFTLAIINGKKAWGRTRLFLPPPSMRKERIDMVIEAREENIPSSGAIELQVVDKILEQLTIMASETDASTLKGIDGKDRLVQIDQDGFSVESVVNETSKEPEYRVNLTCWALY